MVVRSLPHTKEGIERMTKKFFVDRPGELLGVVKSIKKALKVGMTLPSYIHRPTEDEAQLVTTYLDLMMDDTKQDEYQKYMTEATDEEIANIRLLIMNDRIFS